LSPAAIDGHRTNTLYLATGGGIGPGTVSTLLGVMRVIAGAPRARLVAATDANRAGDRYAERLSEIAAEVGIAVERLRPIGATDWNDILQGRAE
jgi:predicted nuclease with TOPRIM domain